MPSAELTVIFPTFEDVETVLQTLPSVVQECRRSGAALIVHDASVKNRGEMWSRLQAICDGEREFLLLTSPISMAAARNLCLETALTLFTPSYICMLEDDHGLRPGAIPRLIEAMKTHYGQPAPNGLRFGLFSGCQRCWQEHFSCAQLPDGHGYPEAESPPWILGGANSCFRCAPTSHWQNVLKGYDVDEYMISNYQTRNANLRNYNRGYTTLYVDGGDLAFSVDRVGQGYTQAPELPRWAENFTASDRRSRFAGRSEGPQG
jgi:hypothetical protein